VKEREYDEDHLSCADFSVVIEGFPNKQDRSELDVNIELSKLLEKQYNYNIKQLMPIYHTDNFNQY